MRVPERKLEPLQKTGRLLSKIFIEAGDGFADCAGIVKINVINWLLNEK